MASEAQYEILRSVYQEENDRYNELINRGKIYLTICSFFLGGLAFKLNELLQNSTWSTKATVLLSVACFIVTFLLIILALRIYEHEGLCNPQKVVDGFGKKPPTDDDFRDARLADIVVATTKNSEINDKRAGYLDAAVWAMFCGVFAGFFGLALTIVGKNC